MFCLQESQKEQPLLSTKRPHFKTHKWPWKEQKYGHGSQWGLKTRITVLAKANGKLLLSLSLSLSGQSVMSWESTVATGN
jgi:hypothetical protein